REQSRPPQLPHIVAVELIFRQVANWSCQIEYGVTETAVPRGTRGLVACPPQVDIQRLLPEATAKDWRERRRAGTVEIAGPDVPGNVSVRQDDQDRRRGSILEPPCDLLAAPRGASRSWRRHQKQPSRAGEMILDPAPEPGRRRQAALVAKHIHRAK